MSNYTLSYFIVYCTYLQNYLTDNLSLLWNGKGMNQISNRTRRWNRPDPRKESGKESWPVVQSMACDWWFVCNKLLLLIYHNFLGTLKVIYPWLLSKMNLKSEINVHPWNEHNSWLILSMFNRTIYEQFSRFYFELSNFVSSIRYV